MADTWDTDEQLVADLQAGKKSAAREVYRRCFGRVRRYYLNKACQPADVEDLVSKVFLAVLEPGGNFSTAKNINAYVMGIARNLWFGYLRKRDRLREVGPDDGGLEGFEQYVERHGISMHGLGAGETTLIDRDRQVRTLLNALRQLSAIYQDVLELYYWEDMTFVELGQALGIPTGTATSRVRLAKAQLCKIMQGVTITPDDPRFDELIAQIDPWARRVASSVRGVSPG